MKTSLLLALLLIPAICYSEPPTIQSYKRPNLQDVACTRLVGILRYALTQYNLAYHGSISVENADQTVISTIDNMYSPFIFNEIFINSPSDVSELTSSAGKLIFNRKLKPEGFERYLEKFNHKCMSMKPLSAQVTSSNHDYSKQ